MDDGLDVVRVGEIVGLDGGVIAGIPGSEPDSTTAFGVEKVRGDGEPGLEGDASVPSNLMLVQVKVSGRGNAAVTSKVARYQWSKEAGSGAKNQEQEQAGSGAEAATEFRSS